MTYNTIPQTEVIKKTTEKLTSNGFKTEVVNNGEEAKTKVLQLIKPGSEVFTMTSITLDETGISDSINKSDKYISVRNMLYGMDKSMDAREMRRMGAAPDYAIGSAHAVTEEGEILVASNTGSQLPAYVYGAEHVIFVIGAQKITKDREDGMKRIYEHVLPLEADRARKAYGVSGSNVSKLLILAKEINPERIHVILVKEMLGF